MTWRQKSPTRPAWANNNNNITHHLLPFCSASHFQLVCSSCSAPLPVTLIFHCHPKQGTFHPEMTLLIAEGAQGHPEMALKVIQKSINRFVSSLSSFLEPRHDPSCLIKIDSTLSQRSCLQYHAPPPSLLPHTSVPFPLGCLILPCRPASHR